METSLRFGRDSKALRIHAKEKFPIDSNTYLQVNIHSLSLFLFACVEVWNYQFIQLLNNLVSFSLWTHLLARSLRPNLLLEFLCLLWEFWSSQIWCCLFFLFVVEPKFWKGINNINGDFFTVCESIWTGLIFFPCLLCACQVHGELDTRVGVPSYLSAVMRHFYPDVCFNLWVALISMSYEHYYGKLVFLYSSIIDVILLLLSILVFSKPWGRFAIW